MEAQFIGYGIARGLGDLGFWLSVSALLLFAPMFWKMQTCANCVLKPERKEAYPLPFITTEAIAKLYQYPASDHSLFDSSRDSPLKQFWATELRNLIEGKIIEKRPDSQHFLINSIDAVIAPFTDEVPVFVLSVLTNDGWCGKTHITANELETVLPCLADMDWRKVVHVGNLAQILRDLAPIIQYEETLRKISTKN